MASATVKCAVLILWCSVILEKTTAMTQSCDSCGGECKPACGTRGFRTCCFNYLKKRNVEEPSTSPEMRLELLMVLPELMQYYHQPSLVKHVPKEEREYPTNSGLRLFYRDTNKRHSQFENYD